MDPTATLNEQLALAQTILADLTWCDADHELNAAAARLADLTQALDGWVRNGGSLPAPWHATARAADTYRIEVWDQGRWVLAPGEATGWSRAGALEVCHDGVPWMNGAGRWTGPKVRMVAEGGAR